MFRSFAISFLSVFAVLMLPNISFAQQPIIVADSYTSFASKDANTNFGARNVINLDGTSRSYIRFNLSTLPAGTTGSQIEKATLKLFVNKLTTSGSVGIYRILNFWDESTITSNNAPGGSSLGGSYFSVSAANQFILVDLTPLVKDWIDGAQLNFGILLDPVGPLACSFDSKEGTHEPKLEITFKRITRITPNAGLDGGGSEGNVTVGIADLGVGNTKLAAGAVTTAKLGDGSITSSKISPGAVGTSQLADGAVTSANIASGAVMATNIAPGAVGTPQLANGAVVSANISPAAVGSVQLADGSVTAAKINTGAVGTTQLANGAVNTNQLADGAVTNLKIGSGQVVKSLNSLKDDITLAAGSNITITPLGNTLTISSAGGGGTNSPSLSINPMQVALLRWYAANQTGITYATGDLPYHIAFDGTNLWIPNGYSQTLLKMRPSDGAVLGTFDTGVLPVQVAYDGANIWVVNNYSYNVMKYRASDGTKTSVSLLQVLAHSELLSMALISG